MLYSARKMNGWKLVASDGEIGHAREVYIDDQHWVVRHVVADTGGWLFGRKVLISPHAIQRVDPEQGHVEVALTQQQIKDAPDIDTDKPVSRQQETGYYNYYGYPYYWAGTGLWGLGGFPMGALAMPGAPPDADIAEAVQTRRRDEDPHLRSSAEIRGYDIEATDGSIGQVEDFLVDDRSWRIRFVVVDTSKWLPGRKVLVPPQWITDLDWSAQVARVKVSRDAVRRSPAYEPGSHLSDDAFEKTQRHFESWQ